MASMKAEQAHLIRAKGAVLFVLALLFAALLCAPGVAAKAHADGPIGTISVNGGAATEYDTYAELQADLAQKATANSGPVVVKMLDDWNVTTPLVIPARSTVTLNMNGHKLDRGLAGSQAATDGNVITVNEYGNLTINGGDGLHGGGLQHAGVTIYASMSGETGSETIGGGLVTGGKGLKHGGGIYMTRGANVTLNRVTVAGCSAQGAYADSTGNGGGVFMCGDSISLAMDNSTIMGNYATVFGGGIYSQEGSGQAIDLCRPFAVFSG